MWFGVAQWFGLESTVALNYALPNMNNFGCRLFSDTDLYEEGTGEIDWAFLIEIQQLL